MKSQQLNGRWVVAFLITAFALCITPAIPAQACEDPPDPNGGFGPNDRPVFLIISLDEFFYTPELGNQTATKTSTCPTVPPGRTVIIELGKFVAGYAIGNTRFDLNDITLPDDFDWKVDGNEMTIIGGLNTTGPNSIHLVSPDGEPIPPNVQEAFFLASPFLTDEFVDQFPTTIDIAQFIRDKAVELNPALGEDPDGEGPEEPLATQDILDHIFDTNQTVSCTEDDGGDVIACEAEGDLFPHQPEERLFSFELGIDPAEGDVTLAMCIDVEIDIKPGNSKNVINYTSDGVVWVAILTTDDFDAVKEVDTDTVMLGGALNVKASVQDVDKDGDKDVKLKFPMGKVGWDESTTEVMLTGMTHGDTCIEGLDTVTVVPPKK